MIRCCISQIGCHPLYGGWSFIYNIGIPSRIETYSVFCIRTYTIMSVFVPPPMYPKEDVTGHHVRAPTYLDVPPDIFFL